MCVGLDTDGILAATTTAICYPGGLAWIGMVLTDPAFRRRGFAHRLLQCISGKLETGAIARIQLDATDMGEPIYRALGFETAGIIERWERPDDAAPIATQQPLAGWQESCNRFDREAFGDDRTALLARLAGLGGVVADNRGYGMWRPGSRAMYFGPCVCQDSATAERMLAACLAMHPAAAFCWDLPAGNPDAVSLARAYGFIPRRRLTRMWKAVRADGPVVPRIDSRVFAIAGLEFG